MNTQVSLAPLRLFRSREDAVVHSLALTYTLGCWLGSFPLMGAGNVGANIVGVLLGTHALVLSAYLIHEAAHQTLFMTARANQLAGEAMNFIAGSSYASFERIRCLHIRHHLDRADLVCFDFKSFMKSHPAVLRTVRVLEWVYIPAAEILMHLQVMVRPFRVPSQRDFRRRVLLMLLIRAGLFASLWYWSGKAALLYLLALLLQLHLLNFFDAFHHSFEQFVVAPDEPLSLAGRDRAYEQANTYSNLLSTRHPWLNALVLNFGYHNAHHHRPSVPWWRLPSLHRDFCGNESTAVMAIPELLATWHRNRVRRVYAEDYGTPGSGERRADSFIGAHGVSFLTVI